jgi:hypothetical protein
LIGVIVVIAFIAVCEIVLFCVGRSGPFVAKRYGLGDVLKFDGETNDTDVNPDLPKTRNENGLL